MIPDYILRESSRAKHVRLRVTPSEGLVVVVPRGFDRARIPGLLEEKKEWIDRALETVAARGESMPPADRRPEDIVLRAIGQKWRVDWVRAPIDGVELSDRDIGVLRVRGAIDDAAAWRTALRKWVVARGREYLIPWLTACAEELGVPIERVSVRCQKTRWGSYSTKGTVSLNAQLLFLPRPLVRYVLIHELCHATQPNHSAAFWQLLGRYEPDALRLRAELKAAGSYVPTWLRFSGRRPKT